MNKEELKRVLEKEGTRTRAYSLDGPLGDEDRFILDKEISGWVVYYTERGGQFSKRIFDSEDEACKYFLDWILKYPELKGKPKIKH